MSDKLARYQQVSDPLPATSRLWPLYGAGLDNLGRDGEPIEEPLPACGPDELLVRHDAVGICFSDIKVIRAGEQHPRIYQDMRLKPVVLGHEVSLTVVGVGDHRKERYRVGERFVIQADIYIDGVSRAYGYDLQGGFSQYNLVGDWVLNGDHGNYLVPISATAGYAESALTEPWACVEAAYNVSYRKSWKPAGQVWIVGDGQGMHLGRAATWRPACVTLSVEDADFTARVQAWGAAAGVDIQAGPLEFYANVEGSYDDILVLGGQAALLEQVEPKLAPGGVLSLYPTRPLSRPVQVDVGRLHYDHRTMVGATGQDLSQAYRPIRSQLKEGGRLWILGAAGPMGHMHIQRALELPGRPGLVVATNRGQPRILETEERFSRQAADLGVRLLCQSQAGLSRQALDEWLSAATGGAGFDDIVVLAPSSEAIEHASAHLAAQGVMNIFAGLPRGTQAALNLNPVAQRGVRYIGTSGSSIADLARMRDLTERGLLSPNRSVAAIASLEGAAEGLRAVSEGRFSGKVVIYPHLRPLPLTPLPGLKSVLPSVHALLEEGREWTVEAERELLRVMLA